MTLSRFEVFNAIVETGSLTKAGELLKISQSGISHAITSLETEFGFSLITRSRTGISLTKNGEHMLTYVRDILELNDKMKQEAALVNGIEIGEVRIGTFTSVSSLWLPEIIKNFQSEYPRICLKLVEGDYASLEQWILNGEIDCGFLTSPTMKTLEFIPLKKDKMLCIVSNEHPLHDQKEITFQQIEKEPLIMPKAGWDSEIRKFFNDHNIKAAVKFELSDDQAIFAFVQKNLGISIRPEMSLSRMPDNIDILNLESEPCRLIGIAAKPDCSPATKKFIDYVQSWLRERHLSDF
ncbi:LysR family transcriptional regulator [Neobacillus mesonae]|uniref:LysR family transcriptional regulator n=1 Tax=Neobacillus mesonae TaxID=1193713 RepID=UPI00204129FA|nr:LysR family transcriptional regulator [Neobacillus mesonae]MCM3570209.1 LysR family transcriptional regulator [Neobacillus mesonae]